MRHYVHTNLTTAQEWLCTGITLPWNFFAQIGSCTKWFLCKVVPLHKRCCSKSLLVLWHKCPIVKRSMGKMTANTESLLQRVVFAKTTLKNYSVQRWLSAKVTLCKDNPVQTQLCKVTSLQRQLFAKVTVFAQSSSPIDLFTMGHLCHSTKRLFEKHHLCRGTTLHRHHFAQESLCTGITLPWNFFAQKLLSTGTTFYRNHFAPERHCTGTNLYRYHFAQEPLCTGTDLCKEVPWQSDSCAKSFLCKVVRLHRWCCSAMGHLFHSTMRLFEQHPLRRETTLHSNHFAQESLCPGISLHRSYFPQEPLSTGATFHRNYFAQEPLCTAITLHRNRFVEEPPCSEASLHRNCFA